MAGHTLKLFKEAYSDDMLDEAKAAGEFDPRKKTIFLHSDCDKEQLVEVYFHELIEAANCFYELRMPHRSIQTLALALHQALTSGKGRLK